MTAPFIMKKEVKPQGIASFVTISLFNRSIQVEGVFGITKQDCGYIRVRRRGIEKVSTEIMLNSLGLNVAKLFRFLETGKLNAFWIAPNDLQPEEFRKPNLKRLIKKGKRINQEMIEGTKIT